ncbi:hypothetical protein FWD20_01230 [Candidatus Saccharibacteria bacterium]|nr:hypothetical protein [Candidatus Saccharibacteria bacterium]
MIITGDEVLEELKKINGIFTDSHLVGTSGKHLAAYFDLRRLFATRRDLLERIGHQLGENLRDFEPDLIVGPETLGRELAGLAAAQLGIPAIHLSKRPVGFSDGKVIYHADYRKTDESKNDPEATPGKDWFLDPKLPFLELFTEKNTAPRVVVVDDLFNTGYSIQNSIAFLREELPKITGVKQAPEIVAAVAVIRRNPHDGTEVTAESLEVPHLVFLKDIDASTPLTPEECARSGMCSKRVPMLPRPGHGYKFLAENPGYPVAE